MTFVFETIGGDMIGITVSTIIFLKVIKLFLILLITVVSLNMVGITVK